MVDYYGYDYVKQADGSYQYVLTNHYTRGYDGTTTVYVQTNPNPATPNSQVISGYYYDPANGTLIPKYGNLAPGTGGNQ